jgi:hypothetical protein
MYGGLTTLRDKAEPLQRAQLMAALSVGASALLRCAFSVSIGVVSIGVRLGDMPFVPQGDAHGCSGYTGVSRTNSGADLTSSAHSLHNVCPHELENDAVLAA